MTPPRMSRVLTTIAASTCLAAAAVVGVPSTAVAATAKACNPPKYPGEGYFTTLTVKGVSCSTGGTIAKEYYRCRMRNGGRKGKCPSSQRIKGYRCRETKRTTIPTEINARVSCTRGGGKSVVHTYQQNT